MIFQLIFACAEFGACPPPPPPAPVFVQHEGRVVVEVNSTLPPAPPASESREFLMVFEDGSAVYSDGTTKCVTGAPCDNGTLSSSDFTYDWETGLAWEDAAAYWNGESFEAAR